MNTTPGQQYKEPETVLSKENLPSLIHAYTYQDSFVNRMESIIDSYECKKQEKYDKEQRDEDKLQNAKVKGFVVGIVFAILGGLLFFFPMYHILH